MEVISRVNAHIRQKLIHESYTRFVPRQFLNLLGKDEVQQVDLGDQKQLTMTVFFCDIRNFTTISEVLTKHLTAGVLTARRACRPRFCLSF